MKTRPDKTRPYAYFFAYGTLRKSVPRSRNRMLRKRSRFIGMGSMQGVLYDLGDYPACVDASTPSERVTGEVYKITHPGSFFYFIDKYEEYDPFSCRKQEYKRTRVTILMKNGRRILAWTYLYQYPVKGRRRIESGDYRLYLKQNRKTNLSR